MKSSRIAQLLLIFLALLGVFSLGIEAWHGSTPARMVHFLQEHNLWDAWNQLRWEHMFTHEVLHFLSGLTGSMLGCWICFALQKRDQRG